jgi:hypothetical protein
MPTIECVECGKGFIADREHIRRGTKCCSKECSNAWRGKHWAGGPDSPSWKRVARTCIWCGTDFMVPPRFVRDGADRFCQRACFVAWRSSQPSRAMKTVVRLLKTGEPIPASKPRVYSDRDGYIRLRWKLGPRDYVETRLHRLIVGLDAPVVHHINGDPNDNSPDNLMRTDRSEHAAIHARIRNERIKPGAGDRLYLR